MVPFRSVQHSVAFALSFLMFVTFALGSKSRKSGKSQNGKDCGKAAV